MSLPPVKLPLLDAEGIRSTVWQAINTAFRVAVSGHGHALQSRFGRDFEILSLSHMLPLEPVAATRHLAPVVNRLLEAIDGARPGGVLVVRGPELAGGVPLGVRASIREIGEHAQHVSLQLVCHCLTIEEARAWRDELKELAA